MDTQRITPEEVKRRMDAGELIAFVDARAPDAWEKSTLQIPGSIRVPPDEIDRRAGAVPRNRLVVPYCT